MGPDFERGHRGPELSASCAHPGAVQAAHQTPRLSQSSSRRRTNSLPAPALACPPLRSLTWAALSSSPARSLHPHSLAWPARDCSPSCRSPAAAAALRRLPDAQANRTARRDARPRAGLARDLGRAGLGGGAVTGVPGTTRHAPCAAHQRPSRPPGSGLASSSATSGSPEQTPNRPSLPPGPRHPRSARQLWFHASPQCHHGPRCPPRASPRDNGSTRPPPQLGHGPRSLG